MEITINGKHIAIIVICAMLLVGASVISFNIWFKQSTQPTLPEFYDCGDYFIKGNSTELYKITGPEITGIGGTRWIELNGFDYVELNPATCTRPTLKIAETHVDQDPETEEVTGIIRKVTG